LFLSGCVIFAPARGDARFKIPDSKEKPQRHKKIRVRKKEGNPEKGLLDFCKKIENPGQYGWEERREERERGKGKG
jgi:hypothetical protein